MKDIQTFLNEMRQSDWHDDAPFPQRMYNGTTVQESENTYYKKVSSLYSDAVLALVNVPSEKYSILQNLIDEIVECQEYFEVPSDELINSYMRDYNQSKVLSLKEDYEYLCFVRKCMKIQIDFLNRFKDKLPQKKSNKTMNIEEDTTPKDNSINNKLIKGVEGLAEYLGIGKTKAEEILNSKILQDKGAAYRIGKGWRINPHELDKLLQDNPIIFHKRNK